MDKKIEEILKIWHTRFLNEENQYSEFEPSDIEYFVGCLLYNHFSFSKALDTMRTMDLSYDFLENCGEEYDDIISIVRSFKFDNDTQKLKFLLDYIQEAKSKYSASELYLLNRFENHIKSMAQRYDSDKEVESVTFVSPIIKSPNPLDRI